MYFPLYYASIDDCLVNEINRRLIERKQIKFKIRIKIRQCGMNANESPMTSISAIIGNSTAFNNEGKSYVKFGPFD